MKMKTKNVLIHTTRLVEENGKGNTKWVQGELKGGYSE